MFLMVSLVNQTGKGMKFKKLSCCSLSPSPAPRSPSLCFSPCDRHGNLYLALCLYCLCALHLRHCCVALRRILHNKFRTLFVMMEWRYASLKLHKPPIDHRRCCSNAASMLPFLTVSLSFSCSRSLARSDDVELHNWLQIFQICILLFSSVR